MKETIKIMVAAGLVVGATVALALLVLFPPLPSARAAGQPGDVFSSGGNFSAQTIGGTSATVLVASGRVFLEVDNLSSTATVCIAFGLTATISTAQCAAGEIALLPNTRKSWEGNFVPADAISLIASAAGAQVTVGAR